MPYGQVAGLAEHHKFMADHHTKLAAQHTRAAAHHSKMSGGKAEEIGETVPDNEGMEQTNTSPKVLPMSFGRGAR